MELEHGLISWYLSGPSKYGKKTTPTISDDERRSTYDQQYFHSSPLFSALGGERKVLVPVSTFRKFCPE
jgi:hypothetical protein